MDKKETGLQAQDYLSNSKRTLQYLISAVAQGGKLISGTQLTIDKIFQVKEEGTVGYLRTNGMEKEVEGLYMLALKECSALCENIFTDESVKELSYIIMNEYPMLRPQEIIVILKNGISGKYGKSYGKVTPMEIMRWTLEYHDERLVYFENKATEKPKADWRDIDANILKEAVKIGIEKEKKKEPNSNNKIIQGWLLEFDRIYKEQHPVEKAVRFINVNGKMMNESDFLEYKIERINC